METNGMQNLRILEIKGLDFRLFLLFTSAQPSAPILTLPHARFRSLSQWRKMPNLPIILHAAFLLFFAPNRLSSALCRAVFAFEKWNLIWLFTQLFVILQK